MEGKLALLYLIFIIVITIFYVEVAPTKQTNPPHGDANSGCYRVTLRRRRCGAFDSLYDLLVIAVHLRRNFLLRRKSST